MVFKELIPSVIGAFILGGLITFIIADTKRFSNIRYKENIEKDARVLAKDVCSGRDKANIWLFADKDLTFIRVYLKTCMEMETRPDNLHEIIYFMLVRMEKEK